MAAMFKNREEAGEKLAQALRAYNNAENTIVLALPRGGVVIGYAVAHALGLPLDIVMPRKIGAPGNPEYAIGAIAETGEAIFNSAETQGISQVWLKHALDKEKAEAQRRLKMYRGEASKPNLCGKAVIIVDDGVATGYTMRAAIASVKSQNSAKIIIAAPTGAAGSIAQIRREVDEVVVLEVPEIYFAVGAQYENFPQINDAQVIALLAEL